MANRMISYGYGMESGKLVVIDSEAEIVRRVLDTYAIEQQMGTNRGEMDGNIELLERTEGEKRGIEKKIERQTNELAVLREQLKLGQAKIESNQSVNTELERINKLLTDASLNFDVYDDRSVRLLIEYIREMDDGKIVLMLKGGITLEERDT